MDVNDTKGDVAAAVSRMKDAANHKVAAGVQVFGMDARGTPLLVTNVTG